MQFFKPPMEHFCGLAYSFGAHYAVSEFEFVNDAKWTGLVLDGDGYSAGKIITVKDMPQSVRLVASVDVPKRLPAEYYDVPNVATAAQTWLAAHPAPKGCLARLPDRNEYM